MKITIRYFALLREERGCGQETLERESSTVEELYLSLRSQHGFRLEPGQIRFAVGTAYVDPKTVLQDGDEVTFLPPVSGG